MYYTRGITSGIKNIILINVAIFLLQNIFSQLSDFPLDRSLSLDYLSIVYEYKFWQIFSYMFLHANWWHLFFNMLALFFIGSDVEREMGTKPFLQFYLASGIGAGLFIFIVDAIKVLVNSGNISNLGHTVGASGAIFGVLLAFSVLFRDREITLLLFFVFPVTIKGRNLLIVSLVLTVFLPFLFGGGVRISHSGHIGGVIAGLIFIILLQKNRNFSGLYYCLKEWWSNLRNSFKKTRNNENFFNSPQFNPKSNIDSLDETKMTEKEIENKIDQLLDIISLKGINGLKSDEKKFLERVSFLYRHKFPE